MRTMEAPAATTPRIALLVFDCPDAERLRTLLAEVAETARSWIEEILVVDREPDRWPASTMPSLAAASPVALRFHRNPRRYEYGAARKAAFEYAIARGFDHVIHLDAGGAHPPSLVAELVQAVLAHPESLVVATRPARAPATPGPSLAVALADRVEAVLGDPLHERVLRLGLGDYGSRLRAYPVDALRHVPFQLDDDGPEFDIELLVQLRALGVSIEEVPAPTAWREWTRPLDGVVRVARSALATLGYRLHQLHFTRRGRYLIDHGVHYTLKQSPTGSHMQIVDAIRPESRVLDLGCSQGLLARPLREKKVELTGVDGGPPSGIAREVAAYHQRDLDAPLDLPEGRVFDYVIVADVIEHLRHRQQLLRGARRYLKEDGRLIISTGNVALWFYRLSLAVGRFEYGPRGILDRTHVHLYTRATFRREVERAGFHVLHERVTSLPFEIVFESTGRSAWVQRLARAYHFVARVWPEMFAYQIILEAEIETLDDEAAGEPSPAPGARAAPTDG
jgi:SAM-dependent methyltransferase